MPQVGDCGLGHSFLPTLGAAKCRIANGGASPYMCAVNPDNGGCLMAYPHYTQMRRAAIEIIERDGTPEGLARALVGLYHPDWPRIARGNETARCVREALDDLVGPTRARDMIKRAKESVVS